jgi:hypothetical protein
MQVRNFYEDPLPSVRNPLNSIALSPDSIRYNNHDLRSVPQDFGDFQSIMPPLNSCLLYSEGNCRKPAWLVGWFQRCWGRNKSEKTAGTRKGE